MSTSFDIDRLATILDLLTQHDVREFKLEREGEKLWLRRGPEQPIGTSAPVVPQAMQNLSAPAAVQPDVTPQISSISPSNGTQYSLKEVRSPMVGTFYRRPAVDAEPYVQVGDTVKKGDVLCIVEAMKLMNEIESDVDGRIVEIVLEDGQMVEYGEVMFRIEPVS